MKKKWLWGIITAFVLLLATAGVTIGETAVPEVKSLSLNQAIEMAMKDNDQVELAVLGVEKAELELERKEFSKEKALDSLKNPDRKDQLAAIKIDVEPVIAQSEKVIADVTKVYTENNIKFGVESAYYGVLRAEKMLEVSQASYKRTQEQLKQAQAKFKAGTVAKIDVISAEAQEKSVLAALNASESLLKIARMGFNQTIGTNLDTPLKLTDKFNYAPNSEIDTEKVFQEMTAKDLSYVAANEGFTINKAVFDYHKKYYTPNTFDYRDAEYNYKDAEVKFENGKSGLALRIKTAYLDLKSAEDNYQTLSKSLELAKEAYRLTKLRYDVGMATGYDVLSAEGALKEADLGLLNTLYDYNLAKAKFAYGVF